MRIFGPRETKPDERRVPLIPETVSKLAGLGADIAVESGLGRTIQVPDQAFAEAGASIPEAPEEALQSADIVLRLNPPSPEDAGKGKSGALHISYMDPFNNPELVRAFAESNTSAVSMEMIPRSTIAQKMDALSSQANLAGYVAVLLAAGKLDKILPMMMTPAGTITPARVFIIGAGVAGLQAIATARRLGARVDAFDTRPVVAEQVKSLGAKFLNVDLGETGQTRDGYARELTDEQLQKQQEAMAKACAQADIVITTAQVFGKKAPRIITADMIRDMKAGSVLVDLAVSTGGNIEGSRVDETVETDGKSIIGLSNYPGQVPVAASRMYSSNLANFIDHFWDTDSKTLPIDPQDEILKSCLITHGGEIVHETIRDHLTTS